MGLELIILSVFVAVALVATWSVRLVVWLLRALAVPMVALIRRRRARRTDLASAAALAMTHQHGVPAEPLLIHPTRHLDRENHQS